VKNKLKSKGLAAGLKWVEHLPRKLEVMSSIFNIAGWQKRKNISFLYVESLFQISDDITGKALTS
jgi:hypothetical protein